jgi:pimeloyl-ACP methyl ester carboxylesterase
MQESVDAELLKRGIEEVAVVGVSMGGYRALHMALSSRVRVSHVVTLGGFAHYGEEEVAAILGFADMLQPLADFSSSDIRAIAPPRFLSPTYLEQHPEAAALVQSWLDVTTPSALAAELRTVANFPNLLPKLGALNVPVTAIVGEKDAATPVALSEEIANACPQGKLVVAPGHGHALTIEAMDELRRAVANAVGLGEASAWEA